MVQPGVGQGDQLRARRAKQGLCCQAKWPRFEVSKICFIAGITKLALHTEQHCKLPARVEQGPTGLRVHDGAVWTGLFIS